MQSNANVIIDTSVWVDFLRGLNPAIATQLGTLINQRQAFLCGIVLAEVLSGVRYPHERATVDDLFRALPYVETSRATWLHTGELPQSLRSPGLTTPLSDLILASLSLQSGSPIFTHDTHLQPLPNPSLHHPSPPSHLPSP